MNYCRYLAVLALLLPSITEAASVIKQIVACKDEADSRKVLDFLDKKDTAGLDKFSAPKLARRLLIPFEKHGGDNRHEGWQAFLRAPLGRA
jgi:hypothetical protein